ncbi:cytochrome P450 [Streptomyces sp. NPDC002287]
MPFGAGIEEAAHGVGAGVKRGQAGDGIDFELSGLVVDLLVDGFDTISHQLSLAVIAFSDHPHQRNLLREHPELGEQAVNEVLRYSPAATIWRHMAAGLHHKGLHIPAGTPVHLSAHAARRDPRSCPDGDTFDITRGRSTTLLAFGGGAHYCPGAALARTELAEALTALASRLGPHTSPDRSPGGHR